MKYIMFEVESKTGVKGETPLRIQVPVIFPDIIVHADMNQVMLHLLRRRNGFRDIKPVSAGSINLTHPNGILCSGDSETLGLKSSPEDGKTIETYNYTHGMV